MNFIRDLLLIKNENFERIRILNRFKLKSKLNNNLIILFPFIEKIIFIKRNEKKKSKIKKKTITIILLMISELVDDK